jgi:uncharacterized protein YfiM (DUF2279 family)
VCHLFRLALLVVQACGAHFVVCAGTQAGGGEVCMRGWLGQPAWWGRGTAGHCRLAQLAAAAGSLCACRLTFNRHRRCSVCYLFRLAIDGGASIWGSRACFVVCAGMQAGWFSVGGGLEAAMHGRDWGRRDRARHGRLAHFVAAAGPVCAGGSTLHRHRRCGVGHLFRLALLLVQACGAAGHVLWCGLGHMVPCPSGSGGRRGGGGGGVRG